MSRVEDHLSAGLTTLWTNHKVAPTVEQFVGDPATMRAFRTQLEDSVRRIYRLLISVDEAFELHPPPEPSEQWIAEIRFVSLNVKRRKKRREYHCKLWLMARERQVRVIITALPDTSG